MIVSLWEMRLEHFLLVARVTIVLSSHAAHAWISFYLILLCALRIF